MRRREFIALLSGMAAVASPLVAHAQKLPKIGVVWHAGSAEEKPPT